MSLETRVVAPSGRAGHVTDAAGRSLPIPTDWVLLPPGDAALTRRVKAAGPHWVVQETQGRRTFSKGICAPRVRVRAIEAALLAERADPAYQKRLASGRARREREQAHYADEFERELRRFLAFHPRHEQIEQRLARLVSEHATPVGSGTVARTKRISVSERAQAALIAWMRHATTAYDQMQVARVRGRRRELRRELAQRSRALLEGYRRGEVPSASCPLQRALLSSE